MPYQDRQAQYAIKLAGEVDESLVNWFGPVEISSRTEPDGSVVSTLSGIAADQAALVGLIRRLHAMGIIMLSVERVPISKE